MCVFKLVVFNYVLVTFECFWFVLCYLVNRKLMCSCVSVIMICWQGRRKHVCSFCVMCAICFFEKKPFCACVTQGPRLGCSPFLVSYALHSSCTQVTHLRRPSFLRLTLKISFGGAVCKEENPIINQEEIAYCL